MRKHYLIASGLLASIVLAAVLLRVRAEPSSVHAAGLHGTVTLIRDRWGVTHLFASDQHDVFLAQGYLNAQDRLWQMLLRRQAANGRLADWLGASASGSDALLARQGFYQAGCRPGWEELDLNTRQALEAYTDGINAYLDQLESAGFAPATWSIEMAVLKSRGISRPVERWTVQDSLAIACMIDWAQELIEADRELIERLGSSHAAELVTEGASSPMAAPYSPELRLVLQLAAIPLRSDFPQAGVLLPAGYSAPIVPAAWTMAGLHSPSYEAAGATLPGLPGVVAGRGAQRAWDIKWSKQMLEAGNAAVACPACVGLDELAQAESTQKRAPQDVPSELAQRLTPYLVALETRGWLQERVTSMMSKWDYRLEAGSSPAAVYEAWLAALGRRTLADELGAELHARYAASGREAAVLARLATQPASPWWDDVTTAQRESRDEIMQLAYADALDYLGRHYGDLHTIWEWGQMHAVTFEHALGGDWPRRLLLNRGPIPLGGDNTSDPSLPFNPAESFEPALVPALQWRLTGGEALSFALAGDQPGAARRGLAAWQAGECFPLLWDEAEVKANARSELIFRPWYNRP
ncbi:MAG: penicillin acylase family protein [Thermoflexales bacterium]|nr:penicillin acylase family protein [Thermoflexales bacterium]